MRDWRLTSLARATDVAANLIGRANARQGARRLFAVLQNRRLNRVSGPLSSVHLACVAHSPPPMHSTSSTPLSTRSFSSSSPSWLNILRPAGLSPPRSPPRNKHVVRNSDLLFLYTSVVHSHYHLASIPRYPSLFVMRVFAPPLRRGCPELETTAECSSRREAAVNIMLGLRLSRDKAV